MTLAAVTFDFWETLCRDTPEGLARAREMRLAALAEALGRGGCSFAAAAIEAAYERGGTEMSARYWQRTRDTTIEMQVRVVLDCLEPGLCGRLDPALLAAAVEGYAAPVLHVPPPLLPGAAEAVRALAARGLRLGIISNTGRTPGRILRRVLEGHGLLGLFSVLTYSDEAGVRKPDGAIFASTLAALGVVPEEALHVGDNPDADVLGARRAGMRAAHYVGAGSAPAADADVVVEDLAELPARLDGLPPGPAGAGHTNAAGVSRRRA